MRALLLCWATLPAVLGVAPAFGAAEAPAQLVFGSFREPDNASRWATEVETRLGSPMRVERVHREDGVWYRVRSHGLAAAEQQRLRHLAAGQRLAVWTIHGSYENPGTVTSSLAAPAASPTVAAARPADRPAEPAGSEGITTARRAEVDFGHTDIDLGLQTRTYARRGTDGQGRFQGSVSGRFEFHRGWDDQRSSITFTPFLRIDAEDDERTHFDVRELFVSRVGDDWELHVGARQIFWGVTEFNHLVDVINQTDLVESIDGEDKLGQPMVQLSLVRDWGILDLFALTGFRERTFPGEQGRLRSVVQVDADAARYASGAGRYRVDGAVRWSHHSGPLNFGLHYFSGTSRDPLFVPGLDGGEPVLIPEYHVIDQVGFDGQAIFGDWAWKLEALRRSGQGDRYHAFTAGFERTLVGALGTRGDVGLVLEYMYDERDEDAFDTLFEHDLALGTRWQANDLADTTALAGVILDVHSQEYVLSLEASRRLGTSWQLVVEGYVFGGASEADPGTAGGDILSRALQNDDFLQLELTRYF